MQQVGPRLARFSLSLSLSLTSSSPISKHATATPAGELAPLLDALTSDALAEMRSQDKEDGEQQSLWHRRLGGVSLAHAVAVASSSTADPSEEKRWVRSDGSGDGTEALASLVAAACSLLRDAAEEPRVRHAAAGLLGALAAASSTEAPAPSPSPSPSPPSRSSLLPPVWVLGARDAIFAIVERDWDRDVEEEEEGK